MPRNDSYSTTPDSGTNMRLEIELVPRTVWFSSLYHMLPLEIWASIREKHIQTTGARCEICGSSQRPLQLHEMWQYDDEKHIQKLLGFELLCRKCHSIQHIGLAMIRAGAGGVNYDMLAEHFCRVNRCSRQDFDRHVDKAFKVWRERSKHKWSQNLGEYERYVDRNQLREVMKEGYETTRRERGTLHKST